MPAPWYWPADRLARHDRRAVSGADSVSCRLLPIQWAFLQGVWVHERSRGIRAGCGPARLRDLFDGSFLQGIFREPIRQTDPWARGRARACQARSADAGVSRGAGYVEEARRRMARPQPAEARRRLADRLGKKRLSRAGLSLSQARRRADSRVTRVMPKIAGRVASALRPSSYREKSDATKEKAAASLRPMPPLFRSSRRREAKRERTRPTHKPPRNRGPPSTRSG